MHQKSSHMIYYKGNFGQVLKYFAAAGCLCCFSIHNLDTTKNLSNLLNHLVWFCIVLFTKMTTLAFKERAACIKGTLGKRIRSNGRENLVQHRSFKKMQMSEITKPSKRVGWKGKKWAHHLQQQKQILNKISDDNNNSNNTDNETSRIETFCPKWFKNNWAVLVG